MRKRLLPALLLAMAGCQSKPRPVTLPQAPPPGPHVTQVYSSITADRSDIVSTPGEGDTVVVLDVYELLAPYGRISQNDEFWRRIDEDHVNPVNHDLMLRNGIRYGMAPNSEWPYFKSLIEQYCPKSKKGSTPPAATGYVQLPMGGNIEAEDIFYFTGKELTGRTFHQCENLLNVTYEVIPHRAGDTRIKMGALVRDLQQQLEVTVLNQSRLIDAVHPFQLYDLEIEAEVPNDQFLIVAPSNLLQFPMNLGKAFFLRPDKASMNELALVIVPRPFRISKPVSMTQQLPGAPEPAKPKK